MFLELAEIQFLSSRSKKSVRQNKCPIFFFVPGDYLNRWLHHFLALFVILGQLPMTRFSQLFQGPNSNLFTQKLPGNIFSCNRVSLSFSLWSEPSEGVKIFFLWQLIWNCQHPSFLMQVILTPIGEIHERQIPRMLKVGLKVNLFNLPEIFTGSWNFLWFFSNLLEHLSVDKLYLCHLKWPTQVLTQRQAWSRLNEREHIYPKTRSVADISLGTLFH